MICCCKAKQKRERKKDRTTERKRNKEREMATANAAYPSAAGGNSGRNAASPSPIPQWYEQQPKQQQNGGEIRSVTPAMNNTRGASYPSRVPSPQQFRNGTPQRYYGAYNAQDSTQQQQQSKGPSSTGLIRLTLRKPMGIVFEPMYDPNQPSVQRGVRICDLPRTGAAALSRKLEVGDELLSINDKTMSRLTFDEIMDFIIEADPEQVNLLFRRPRRETLQARNQPKQTSTNNASVKWVDDDQRKKKQQTKSDSKKKTANTTNNNKKDDDTLETAESRGGTPSSATGKRKNRRGKDYHESESFLDLLIDTICANPDTVCKSSTDRRRPPDDDFDSDDEDDRTFTSQDDSTYVTYESDAKGGKGDKKQTRGGGRDDEESFDETEDDTISEDERKRRKKELLKAKEPAKSSAKYEDDYTLESIETKEREKGTAPAPVAAPPLGLAVAPQPPPPPVLPHIPDEDENTNSNPAPITEVEYDEHHDHGADVSVMESLGGPSLLIEKQRQAAAASKNVIPVDILKNFGLDYPADFGLTREETITKNPVQFYTFVVKRLLEEHEPEKVRLLDKLLAKYKGREDHLVQKLSVRYNKNEGGNPVIEENSPAPFGNFTEAVNRNKESEDAVRNVEKAQERAAAAFGAWPEKETKEDEPEDQNIEVPEQEEEDSRSNSESGSEYSGDSIDGTSPAVIAQVSELLNYVYGKTSVPGQIDRVSTIMRAYEGREAVLLELLETKALIKANSEKENAANLPSFLRNSPALQHQTQEETPQPATVLSPIGNQQTVGGNIINDDISSMSGVSSPQDNPNKSEPTPAPAQASAPSPARQRVPTPSKTTPQQKMTAKKQESAKANSISKSETKTPEREKKKKKGLFGGLFGKKKNKGAKSTQQKAV